MSFVIIRQKIKEKLDLRKGDSESLVEVHSEHRTNLSGYPSVTFEPSSIESDFQTTVQNERKYVYRIIVHQEMEKVGREKAIGILDSVIDTLIQDFEEDWSLGGTVNFCQAVPVERGEYNEGAGVVMYSELKLECVKSITV